MVDGVDGVSIFIADDSKDDCRLIERAFAEAGIFNPVEFVHDGQQLLDALRKAGPDGFDPLPGLILLDLNMPVLGGLDALKAIRADPRLQMIPVLVLSTSNVSSEVLSCYRFGANSVLVKPFSYSEFIGLMELIKRYWLQCVQLPNQHGGD